MTTAAASSNTDDCEPCVLCSVKCNRTRPSFCQCKHCSILLCFDCMKEHHDDILQNVAQLSHHYNELEELLQTKQNMILDETMQTIDDVNGYFDTYITELRETQQKIIQDIQAVEQDAQNDVVRMSSDLQSLGIDIQALAKESIVQTTKMKTLSAEMKRIEEQLNTYRVLRTEKLIKAKPEFSIKFDCSFVPAETLCSPDIETNEICETDTKEASSTVNSLSVADQPLVVQEPLTNQAEEHNYIPDEFESLWIFAVDDDDDNYIQGNHIPTANNVERMASDEENIPDTSNGNDDHNLIAYCLMNDKYGYQAEYLRWEQALIEAAI